MMWKTCLILSIFFFIVTIIVGTIWRRQNNIKNLFTSVTVLMGATFVSSLFSVFPYCWQILGQGFSELVDAIALTLRTSLQMFSLDAEYLELYECISDLGLASGWRCLYQGWSAFLYVFAPFMLISFVITLFQRVLDRFKMRRSGKRNIYVFSELNERSLILAHSCIDNDENSKSPILVFTDVYEQSEERPSELINEARGMGAVCMREDILELPGKYKLEKKKNKVYFFILGSDDTENTGHALSLIKSYGHCPNMYLYIHSDSVETELMLESVMNVDTKMEIRQINSAQYLVYSYLYDTENNCLFDYACESPDGKKILSIVLVGLGKQGTEFLRALVWYGQMPDIRLQIHVFERDPLAERKFASLCPDLMEMNHNEIKGESQYDIWFHHAGADKGIDAETIDFDGEILKLDTASVAFVTLGDDAENIRIAVKMRRLFSQRGLHPLIQAVVYDSKRNDMLKHSLCNFRGKEYDISFIGNEQEMWSYDNVVRPELEKVAKERHLKWVDRTGDDCESELHKQTIQFYQYEYFRKSSMSSAIRSKVRKKMQLPGTEKEPEKRTEEERRGIQQVEHAGWNAYMRSEGYKYSPERDDMAKCHFLLISFDELPEREKIKDDD